MALQAAIGHVLAATAQAAGSLPIVPLQGTGDFLWLGIVFFVLALLAAFAGFRGIAGITMSIARLLILVFVVLAIVAILL